MATVEIQVNCPDDGSAAEIAAVLVSERLAAACNVGSPIESWYWWEGEVHVERERTLWVKTRADLSDVVIERLRSLHPYDLPAVLVFTPSRVGAGYEEWVNESTEELHRR